MAKKGKVDKPEIPIRCEYCKHNLGENKQFSYMWHCSHLSHCANSYVVCRAQKEGKGKYEFDKEKYEEWKAKKEKK